jgi:hypothetical protein
VIEPAAMHQIPPPSSLPAARLIERRHRLAALPAPPLRLRTAPIAAAGRALAGAMIGLWPVTAVMAIAAALVASAAV